MSEKIVCRVVIEVLGKPREHVEGAMQSYIEKLKKDERYTVIREDSAEMKKQESELWTTFTELEIEMKKIQDMTSFCFDYMPSIMEVLEPVKLTLSDREFSDFFNDLQAKLHGVDMIAKQVKMENNGLKLTMNQLLKNYLTILLGKGDSTLEQLSKLTGVAEDKLGDYLDKLMDEGFVKMEKGVYSLNREKFVKNE